jgi:triosephosphate isomerase
MKHLFIAGNWKSNKTTTEAIEWLQKFKIQNSKFKMEYVTVVVCIPFTILSIFRYHIQQLKLPIQLGAQDVSPYPDGAYTGAVSARQLKELCDWVIIGHSERRKYFRETDIVLAQKVDQAKDAGLKIIYCVPDENVIVPQGVDVIAYEPIWAIGTGKTDTPENASTVIETIKKKTGVTSVIYGGSVTPENVASFVTQPAIDGVLSGGASLDPEKFYRLIESASHAV